MAMAGLNQEILAYQDKYMFKRKVKKVASYSTFTSMLFGFVATTHHNPRVSQGLFALSFGSVVVANVVCDMMSENHAMAHFIARRDNLPYVEYKKYRIFDMKSHMFALFD